MSWSIIKIVLLCAGANYIIRVIPWLINFWEKVPQAVRRFLCIMPTAALGALIFPGSLTALADTGRSWAAAGGLAAAATTALFSKNLIFPVTSAILVTWIILQLPI